MIYILLIGTIIFFGNGSAYTVNDCPPGVTRDEYLQVFGNHCYRFEVNRKHDFQDAQDICKKDGGNLALVKTDAINNFIGDTIIEKYPEYDSDLFWIGLRFVNGSYHWVDGSPIHYGKIKTNDDRFGLDECMVLDEIRMWLHRKCKTSVHDPSDSNSRHYICGYPVIPEITVDDCPKSFTRDKTLKVFGEKCYKFEGNSKTFDNAQLDCKQHGGNLASVKSRNVKYFILRDLFHYQYGIRNVDKLWIGLRYSSYADAFIWTDNSPMNYEDFGSGRYRASDNVCVAISTHSGEWDTKACTSGDDPNFDTKLPYLCEYPTSTTEATTTMATTKQPPSTTTTKATTTKATTTKLRMTKTTTKPPPSTTVKATTKPPPSTTTEATTKSPLSTTAKATTKPPPSTTTEATTKPPLSTTAKATTKPPPSTTTEATTKSPPSTTTEATTKPPPSTTAKATTKSPLDTTTPRTTSSQKQTCIFINCDLNCGFDGYRTNPETGCVMCECDD